MNESKRLSPKIISLIVIVLIAGASTGVYAITQVNKNEGSTSSASTSQSTVSDSTADSSTSSTSTSTGSTASYKDGSYTEKGSYITPGGGETITVTVTLASGTITEVSATGSGNDRESGEYQDAFLSNYKTLVVGKSIDAVSLSRVAGSSLTSNGFNKALDAIKDDAKA